MDTRSLSFCSLNVTGPESNSTLDLALLFYENPNGSISALLQRDIGSVGGGSEWIDITSQGSISLPGAFRIAPGHDLDSVSPTLYESITNVSFNTPFTCTAEIGRSTVNVLFYSSNNGNPLNGIYYEPQPSEYSGFMSRMCSAYPFPQ